MNHGNVLSLGNYSVC